MKRAITLAAILMFTTPISHLAMQQDKKDDNSPEPSQQKTKKKAKDPVCGMEVSMKSAAGESTYKGKTYYFCSVEDKQKFDREPAKYVK